MGEHFFSADKVPPYLYNEYETLLKRCGLRDERDTEQTVLCMDEDDTIIACGSRRGNVLKQIAVSPDAEAGGLCSQVVTELIGSAAMSGQTHLFLYTSPDHQTIFSSLGFYPVVKTGRILLMDNRRRGLDDFIASLPKYEGRVGAVVCNCNPFTLGHRHLIEHASKNCDELMVFVLSGGKFMFSAEERFELVKQGTADLENVHVFRSNDYIISSATFPTYFIKDEAQCADAACELDVELFAARIAPALNISVRFVGQEPFDAVTRKYNETLKAVLPKHGIELEEIERYNGISASKIRKMISEGRIGQTQELLPKTTYDYCCRKFGTGTLVP